MLITKNRTVLTLCCISFFAQGADNGDLEMLLNREPWTADADYSKANLRGKDLSKLSLSESNFSNAKLGKANLAESSFELCNFDGANFARPLLPSEFIAQDDQSNLFYKTSFKGSTFKKAKLNLCQFKEVDFTETLFDETILDGVIFENCIFKNAFFKNTSLSNAFYVEGIVAYPLTVKWLEKQGAIVEENYWKKTLEPDFYLQKETLEESPIPGFCSAFEVTLSNGNKLFGRHITKASIPIGCKFTPPAGFDKKTTRDTWAETMNNLHGSKAPYTKKEPVFYSSLTAKKELKKLLNQAIAETLSKIAAEKNHDKKLELIPKLEALGLLKNQLMNKTLPGKFQKNYDIYINIMYGGYGVLVK